MSGWDLSDAIAMCTATPRDGRLANSTFDRTAGSHSLAARPVNVNVIRTEMRLAASERQAENTAMSTVRTKVRSLSVADRRRLLEEIWDSLAETPEAIPVTDAQRKELARRRHAHARNPSAAKSWAEVRARLRRRK